MKDQKALICRTMDTACLVIGVMGKNAETAYKEVNSAYAEDYFDKPEFNKIPMKKGIYLWTGSVRHVEDEVEVGSDVYFENGVIRLAVLSDLIEFGLLRNE